MAFAIDYVQILLDALERRGVRYAVAASVTNTDVTITSETGDTFRLTDRDVILMRRIFRLISLVYRTHSQGTLKRDLLSRSEAQVALR